jgi:hypothetical protein
MHTQSNIKNIILDNIVEPESGVTILFNVVDNCEQCGQQNIVQSCFHQHCKNLIATTFHQHRNNLIVFSRVLAVPRQYMQAIFKQFRLCFYLQVKGTKIFKSGTDFRNFSEIEVVFSSNDDSYEIQSKKHEITKDVPENPEIKVVVDKYLGILFL